MKSLKTIPKREKRVRQSKAEKLRIDEKGYGREPVLLGTPTDSEYGAALNWYSATCSADEAREFLKDYLNLLDRPDDLKILGRVTDPWLPRTSAWIARMVVRGTDVPEKALMFLEERLIETLDKFSEEPKTVTVTDRIKARCNDAVGEIEALIDRGVDFSLYDWLTTNGIRTACATAVIERYFPWYEELVEALTAKDPQLREAYAYLSKRELRNRMTFIEKLLVDAERYGSVKKTRTRS